MCDVEVTSVAGDTAPHGVNAPPPTSSWWSWQRERWCDRRVEGSMALRGSGGEVRGVRGRREAKPDVTSEPKSLCFQRVTGCGCLSACECVFTCQHACVCVCARSSEASTYIPLDQLLTEGISQTAGLRHKLHEQNTRPAMNSCGGFWFYFDISRTSRRVYQLNGAQINRGTVEMKNRHGPLCVSLTDVMEPCRAVDVEW